MGCCQSDLKGEQPTGTNADAPEPMKKVATNFTNIDYDSSATNRRETLYAPHEEISEANELPAVAEHQKPSTPPMADRNKSAVSPKTSRVPDPKTVDHLPEGGEAQQPYKDVTAVSPTSPTQVNPTAHNTAVSPEITSPPTGSHTTDDMGLFSKSKPSEQPVINGTETGNTKSSDMKMEFSNSIDPAGGESVESGQMKEKKSLYQKYQDKKRGPGTSGLNDEDLLKYTGKTRAEFEHYSKNTSGVGGNQAAGSLLAGGNSGLGIADGGGLGLGGWGRSESTRRPDVS